MSDSDSMIERVARAIIDVYGYDWDTYDGGFYDDGLGRQEILSMARTAIAAMEPFIQQRCDRAYDQGRQDMMGLLEDPPADHPRQPTEAGSSTET